MSKANSRMTYIYGIFYGSQCMYIGRTNREPQERYKEHINAIEKRGHSVKSLNKLNVSELSFCVLYQAETDNSLLGFIMESCANSIYKPKNRIIEQQGRRWCVFARIDKKVAEEVLEVITSK